jgi:hypothetical protein
VSSDVIVYVTRTGSKYHKSSCGYLHASNIPMNFKDQKVFIFHALGAIKFN